MLRPVATARLASSLAAAGVLLASCGSDRPLPTRHSRSSHVVEIVMENKEAADVLGRADAPYVNRLARRAGVASASFAVTHPSLPNYLALTSGATHGISSDCTDCHVASDNLASQIERAHGSWSAYMEDLPSPCFKGAGAGGYAKKHDPFAYYDDVAGSPASCRRIVPLSRLRADLAADRLPRFVFIAPNICNDTHDCPVRSGDDFLAHLVPGLLQGLGPHGFLVLTWDEGSSDAGCCNGSAGGRIATIVAGPDVRPGARTAAPVDHYGVLRTVEQTLGLPLLGAAADPVHGSLAPLFRAGKPRRLPAAASG